MNLWTFEIIDDGLGEFSDLESLCEMQFFPSRVAYRTWDQCREAAATTLEDEAKDLTSRAEGEEDIASAEDYTDAAIDVRALSEPNEEHREPIEGTDLVVFFYNITLED